MGFYEPRGYKTAFRVNHGFLFGVQNFCNLRDFSVPNKNIQMLKTSGRVHKNFCIFDDHLFFPFPTFRCPRHVRFVKFYLLLCLARSALRSTTAPSAETNIFSANFRKPSGLPFRRRQGRRTKACRVWV